MKGCYLIFAFCVFALFCMLEYRGAAIDINHQVAKPKYFSYRGASSSGGYSRSRGYYHK